MGLESATYISQLVNTNPAATDQVSAGDDHIRLIKKALVNHFGGLPNAQTYESQIVTGTLTGCSTSPTVAVQFRRFGPIVTCVIPAVSATSNTASMTMTLTPPSGFWPSILLLQPIILMDNSAAVSGAVYFGSANQFDFYCSPFGGTPFTNSGSKGLTGNSVLTWLADL